MYTYIYTPLAHSSGESAQEFFLQQTIIKLAEL